MGFPRQEHCSRLTFPSPGGSPRDRTCVSCVGRQILYSWATREAWKLHCCVSEAIRSSLQARRFSSVERKFPLPWAALYKLMVGQIWSALPCATSRWWRWWHLTRIECLLLPGVAKYSMSHKTLNFCCLTCNACSAESLLHNGRETKKFSRGGSMEEEQQRFKKSFHRLVSCLLSLCCLCFFHSPNDQGYGLSRLLSVWLHLWITFLREHRQWPRLEWGRNWDSSSER